MLTRERERLFQDLAELVPDPAILAVFQLPHDYHNVKVLLKSEAMGIQEDRLLDFRNEFFSHYDMSRNF